MQAFLNKFVYSTSMSPFQIDSRLAADTLPIGRFQLCHVLLMNDARWPWLILVPEIVDVEEIHMLAPGMQRQLAEETAGAALALKNLTGCEKINSGALGNVVRQLHVHVVARNEEDPNWPGPVWGYGKRVAYENAYGRTLAIKLREELQLIDGFEGRHNE